MSIVWTAASLILTRCFQVYSQAQTQRADLQRDMSAQLYDRMQDSQEGVVSAIMEEMADQQFKQMLLAYTLLLLNQGPMHIDDLDNDCEELLVKEFDSRIDFQVTDALPRLQRWGLVSCNDRDELSACPLTDAIDTLTAAWTIAYKALGGGHASSISTYDLLTGKASTFGAGLDQWRKDKAHLQALTSASEADAKRGVFGKAKNVLGFGKGRSGNQDADGGSEGGLGTEGGSVASGAELEESGSGGEKKKKFSLKKLLA